MVTQLCGFPVFFPSGRAGRSENVEEPITWGSNCSVLLWSQKFFLKFFVERARFRGSLSLFRDLDQGSSFFVAWYFQRLAIIIGWISTVESKPVLVYIQIQISMSVKYKTAFCFIVLLYVFEVVQNIFWCPEVRSIGMYGQGIKTEHSENTIWYRFLLTKSYWMKAKFVLFISH